MDYKFNYSEFQDMDYVFTAGLNWISCRIRITEAGWKNIFNTKIGTHEGRLVSMGNGPVKAWYILEMDPMGDKSQPGHLKLHNLSKYLNTGPRGSKVVSIRRSPRYQDPQLRQFVTAGALEMWQEGKCTYDLKGAASHSKFYGWLGESKKASSFYCSEWSEYLDQHFGKFSTVGALGKTDNIMPYTHQCSKETQGIAWRKSA